MSNLEWSYLWCEGSRSTEWSHSGIAVLESGRVLFGAPWGSELVSVLPDGSDPRYMSTGLRELHGISVSPNSPMESVWIADPGIKSLPSDSYTWESAPGRAGIFNLSTRTFRDLQQPALQAYLGSSWHPTAVVESPGTAGGDSAIWVADGYGANLLHRFSPEGVYDRTLAGTPDGVQFDCPHGLVVDKRGEQDLLWVADRANRRLVAFTTAGSYVLTVTDSRIKTPSSLAIFEGDLFVTELDGALLAVNLEGTVRSLVDRVAGDVPDGWPNALDGGKPRRPELVDGRLNSPHGIAMGPTGDVFMTEWVIGGRQIRLRFA